jgi:predicted  nucleic acid-binding Zn-ribbon protein
MNIADSSEDSTVIETQNSAHPSQLEQTNSPFYSVLPDTGYSIINVPILQPAPEQHNLAIVMEHSEDSTRLDWVAEPDSEQQAQVNSEFQQMLTLNEELRQANSDLYTQVEQLKTELAEAEKIFQWQKTRSSVTESIFDQQNQELAAAQEQIRLLSEHLESARQTVQHQDIYIDTYKSQLQISQQRIAQLERECSSLQTNYTDQSQQLLHLENTCRELRARLMRQQRQTLQFKAALEKCLETSIPQESSEYSAEIPDVHKKQSRFSKKARSLFPNAQPIKPWSAEPEPETNPLSNSWVEPSTPPLNPNSTTVTPPVCEPHTPPPSPQVSEVAADSEIFTAESVSHLNQQIDSLIQMFFVSQSPSSSTESMPPQAEETLIVDYAVAAEEKEEPQTPIVDIPDHPHNSSPSNRTAAIVNEPIILSTQPEPQNMTVELEDYWLDTSTATPPTSTTEAIPDSYSPSPLIYPDRPPKGRKSLASVELPNFRRPQMK